MSGEYESSLYQATEFFMTNGTPFGKLVDNGENAGNQHFLLCPQCFPPILRSISKFQLLYSNMHLFFNFKKSKILLFGKALEMKSPWRGLCEEKKMCFYSGVVCLLIGEQGPR